MRTDETGLGLWCLLIGHAECCRTTGGQVRFEEWLTTFFSVYQDKVGTMKGRGRILSTWLQTQLKNYLISRVSEVKSDEVGPGEEHNHQCWPDFAEWIYSKLSIQATKKFLGTLQTLLLLFLCHLHHLQLQVASLCRCWEKKTRGWSFWSPTGCWGWGTPPPHKRHLPSSKNSARLWCTKRHKKALEERPGMNEGFSVCRTDKMVSY